MSIKIVAVKLNDIIKKSILFLIGIIILIMMIYFFMPKSKTTAKYNPGTYTAQIILHSNPVLVEVSVSEDEILDISLSNMNETQSVFYPLFERSIASVESEILENQTTVVTSSADDSVTKEIIVKAVDKALEQAKK